jgi:hypothetical protein
VEARQQRADDARVALVDAVILQRAASARAAEQREDAARAEITARDIAHARQLAAREQAADSLRAQLERQSAVLRGTEKKLSALQAARLAPGAEAPVAPAVDARDTVIAQLRFQLSETYSAPAARARSLATAASFVHDPTNDFSAASGPPVEAAERSPVSPSRSGAGLPAAASPPAEPRRNLLRISWEHRTILKRAPACPPGHPKGKPVIAPLPPWAERPGGP